MAYLQTAISALKAGASFEEFNEADRRTLAAKYGANIDRAPEAREIEARGTRLRRWRATARHQPRPVWNAAI
jgi:hypothetical protein